MYNLDQNRKNPKKYWRTMNSLLGKNKNKGVIKEIVVENGKRVTGMEAAQILNYYFCNIGADHAHNISPTPKKFSAGSVKCKFKWAFPSLSWR